jgi:hypothetical protein
VAQEFFLTLIIAYTPFFILKIEDQLIINIFH